jgi:hypothetical protein
VQETEKIHDKTLRLWRAAANLEASKGEVEKLEY